MPDIWNRIIDPEWECPLPKQITAAVTPTQVCTVPWTDPAQGLAYLELVLIRNLNAAVANVMVWDADIVSTGVAGTSKPSARGSVTAPIINPVRLAIDGEYKLTTQECPNVPIQAGIVVQSDVNAVWVQIQMIKKLG